LSATGVVAALEFEAQSLGTRRHHADGLGSLRDGSLLRVSGVGADNAARAARQLVAAGAGALLSWGVAGALDPALGCGAVLLPAEVLRPASAAGSLPPQRFATCRMWRERVAAALQLPAPVTAGALLTSARPVGAAELKTRLFQDTGAVAVDMESAAVAQVAAEHELPFITLRVVLDGASVSLPASVMRTLEPGNLGRSGLWRALVLVSAPADWGALLRLAGAYRLARRALLECARRGDPTAAPAGQGGG
jgi:adenosylhomocysteine nucleosidase